MLNSKNSSKTTVAEHLVSC